MSEQATRKPFGRPHPKQAAIEARRQAGRERAQLAQANRNKQAATMRAGAGFEQTQPGALHLCQDPDCLLRGQDLP